MSAEIPAKRARLGAIEGVVGREGLTRKDLLVRAGAAGGLLVLPNFLAACGGAGGSTGAAAKASGVTGAMSGADVDHVTWGIGQAAPQSLDIARDVTAGQASFLGLEGLVATDERLKYTPALARSWSQPDPSQYVFKLRQGVRFWDGSPLTVDDAVYAINRHLDPKTGSAVGSYLANVASVKATDEETIVFAMKNPDPTLLGVLTFVHIQPRAFIEQHDGNLGNPGSSRTVMGTGPFEILSFTTEQGVDVKRNETYWGAAPKVKSARLKWFESPQTMLLAMRSKSIDGAFGFPLSEAGSWTKLSGVNTQFLKEDGLNITMISLDLESEPWNDVHVRRAVAHCCDTAGYAKAFLADQALPATTIVPPAMWANVAAPEAVDSLYADLPKTPYNIALAKKELAKSRHPDGFSATVPYPNTYPQVGRALVSLSETLKQIGITLEVKQVTQNQWLNTLLAHKDLGMQVVVFLPDYPDPADQPLVFDASAGATANGFNTASVKDKQVDRALHQQAATTDAAERTRLLGEVLRYNAEQVPYIPLWWDGSTVAVGDDYVYNGFNGLYYYTPWLAYVGKRG